MQIERHVEALDRPPERPVLRQVVVDGLVGSRDLRIAVDQRALEAELLDRALELRNRGVRILHRQRRNADKPIRPLCHLLRENIVGLARHLDGTLLVGDGLDRRSVQRRDHDLDAGLVHQAQALVLEIEQAMPQLAPDMGAERLRIAERGLDREVILERDFSLHVSSRTIVLRRRDYARS
jgi:hypothetical protein